VVLDRLKRWAADESVPEDPGLAELREGLEHAAEGDDRPVLAVDVDGVISLFGFDEPLSEAPGDVYLIDGVAHCISRPAGERLVRLSRHFDLIWATGWEERANEHLPFLLGLPFRDLPCLVFDGRAVFGSAHWKLDAIDEYAGDRPAAWVDDNIDETCRGWAESRSAPTLIVQTLSAVGLTDEHVEELLGWAAETAAVRET
jgi:hypothetical protein